MFFLTLYKELFCFYKRECFSCRKLSALRNILKDRLFLVAKTAMLKPCEKLKKIKIYLNIYVTYPIMKTALKTETNTFKFIIRLISRKYPEMEFKESVKTRFKLSAGLNLDTILSGKVEPTIFKPRLKFKPPLKFFKFGHRFLNPGFNNLSYRLRE